MTKSTDPTDKNPQKLQLPVTDFPMRANLPAREPGWVEGWQRDKVYERLIAKREAENAPVFILHCGPPYANAAFHVGHAFTHTIKDFVVRSKAMAGFKTPFVPGFDCHGLPIEWKVEQDFLRAKGMTKHDVSAGQIRTWCREYAQKWVDVQLKQWQGFGALADFDGYYTTMRPANEGGILREVARMAESGLLYRGLKPVMWSPVEETALAEAEVEYKDVTSTAVYVALELVLAGDQSPDFLLIWTTTPWTLPANKAVAVNENEQYIRIRIDGDDRLFWVAEKTVDALRKSLTPRQLATHGSSVEGKYLTQFRYTFPLLKSDEDESRQIVHGFHVTTEAGTGLVHIAPAHGQEDFQIGKEFGLPLDCPVDGAGKYVADVPKLPLTGEVLAGENIWKAQKKIIAELEASGALLAANEFTHSYPVSWRSKKELIYRTTPQWFIAMDQPSEKLGGKSLREAARTAIGGVDWVPERAEKQIDEMIGGRPDWCISRQRVWGVPIAVFMNPESGEYYLEPALLEFVADIVSQHGIDAWETFPNDKLLPPGWAEGKGINPAKLVKVRDILDVWIDSGTSYAHMVQGDPRFARRADDTDPRPIDMYSEAKDQVRGWFHSSLLMSVAARGQAPYREVICNGHVLDGQGRKFSKSLGNGIDPAEMQQQYGMDVLRLWVAASDYGNDARISKEIMEGIAESYRKFRNTLRWLLGNLNGFDEAKDTVGYDKLPELEQYLLHRLQAVIGEVQGYYAAYQFHRGYRALYEFCGAELSNFYFDVRKDVLYCDAPDSADRRACQTVIAILFKTLTTWLAPLMPFTTDEAWKSRYGEAACVHLEKFVAVEDEWKKDDAFKERWEALMGARDIVNRNAEVRRIEGSIKTNYEAIAELGFPKASPLSIKDRELVSLVCGTSDAEIRQTNEDVSIGNAVKFEKGEKCPRCWRFYEKLATSGRCLRCDGALAAQA